MIDVLPAGAAGMTAASRAVLASPSSAPRAAAALGAPRGAANAAGSGDAAPRDPSPASRDDARLRTTFDQVMGEMLFGQALKAMRKTVGKPAYVHGGQAEEVFTQWLDNELAKKLTASCASQFTGPMYELFTLGRP